MQVKNRSCIRRLSWKTMGAASNRNRIAILAIALTTMLFTALFTIAFSLNDSIQDNNFRQAGGWNHGGFKYLTEEQFNELKEDSLIKEYGLRRFVGMPQEVPFNKSHVEIGYSDANSAHWMYCDPVEGRLPQEGTDEAATDTHVLELLGVEPKLGAQFTLSFMVNNVPTTQTFTLCGWWDYDQAIVANHVLIPQSRVEDILQQSGVTPSDLYGTWNLNVMLRSSLHIEEDLNTILANHGYQSETYSRDNYIATGVNWGYTGAQLASKLDSVAVAAIVMILLIIIFTGYLIIYNVFQISVTNDIRFYGLLKTIGTTGRQIRRIIRQQALLLSIVGIPLGLLLGYGLGYVLTPVMMEQLNGVTASLRSANPMIFIGSALFALFTVLISCHKPGRMAARVSPVEAVRYTEGGKLKNCKRRKQQFKNQHGASLSRMAWVNLGRSRSKTAITVASLSLAVVLLNLTVTFTNGFDLDKYLSNHTVSDFIVAEAGYFQTSSGFFEAERALPETVIDQVNEQGGVEAGGRIYGQTSTVQEFVTEDYFRNRYSRWTNEAYMDQYVASREKNEIGSLADGVQLYGMERYALEKLTLLDGDISKLFEPGSRCIAAVYGYDDYGKPYLDSHWAKLGDTITLRYVEEFEYYDPDTGAVLSEAEIEAGAAYKQRAKVYRDVQYEVAALVGVPTALSYRYYSYDQFVLNDQTFVQDSGTSSIMQYCFDTTQAGNGPMETFLHDFTDNQQPQYDYESKATYTEEFQALRSMFLIFGGVLSFIIGLVGVLNFLNAILTGIVVRRREFAVLQSIGMTGKQLKAMLVWEGVYYALAAVLVSLVLSTAAGPICAVALNSMFWFFTYRFTLGPVLCIAPIFLALGAGLPLLVYSTVTKHSIVERLRQIE